MIIKFFVEILRTLTTLIPVILNSGDDSTDEEADSGDFGITQENSKKPEFTKVKLRNLITKISIVVKMFRKLPTKMDDVFTKYCMEEFKKEVILDVKTRWNALLDMLERFVLLQNCVRNSLINIHTDIIFTEKMFKD